MCLYFGIIKDMKSIGMTEYQGRCDEQDKPVGHCPKVLKEYYNFIKDDYLVRVYAPKNILRETDREIQKNSRVLPRRVVMHSKKTLATRIGGKLNMFKNISLAVSQSNEDILWFFNIEWYFMLWLALHKKPRDKKIIVTMFKEGFKGGIAGVFRQFIFNKAKKKIDLIITSGPSFKYGKCETVFIPDYVYSMEKYDKYLNKEKRDEVVCLGTMGDGKQLEELVSVFSMMDYPLTIAGRFYDKERLEALKSMASENVTIIDKYLSDEEYMDMLSSARYTILPYSKTAYTNQTSGVLQEAMFVNTIPIARRDVLTVNEIPGMPFDEWSDMDSNYSEKLRIYASNAEKIYSEYALLRKDRYADYKVRREYKKVFAKL